MTRTASVRQKAARPSKPEADSKPKTDAKRKTTPTPKPELSKALDPAADLIANQKAELRNQKRKIQNQKVEIDRLKFLLKTQKLEIAGLEGTITGLRANLEEREK